MHCTRLSSDVIEQQGTRALQRRPCEPPSGTAGRLRPRSLSQAPHHASAARAAKGTQRAARCAGRAPRARRPGRCRPGGRRTCSRRSRAGGRRRGRRCSRPGASRRPPAARSPSGRSPAPRAPPAHHALCNAEQALAARGGRMRSDAHVREAKAAARPASGAPARVPEGRRRLRALPSNRRSALPRRRTGSDRTGGAGPPSPAGQHRGRARPHPQRQAQRRQEGGLGRAPLAAAGVLLEVAAAHARARRACRPGAARLALAGYETVRTQHACARKRLQRQCAEQLGHTYLRKAAACKGREGLKAASAARQDRLAAARAAS